MSEKKKMIFIEDRHGNLVGTNSNTTDSQVRARMRGVGCEFEKLKGGKTFSVYRVLKCGKSKSPEYYDTYGRRPGNVGDQKRHMKLLKEQRERQARSRR